MEKIYVLHENDEWTVHLTKQLDALELPYEIWHLDKGRVDLGGTPPNGVFFSRMSASSHTRNHRFAPELTGAVFAWLEAHGRTVVNGSGALRLELSKVNQYVELERYGVKTPRTIAAVGHDEIVEAAKAFAGQPFITKHNRAGKGLGVQLFQTVSALIDYLDGPMFEEPVDGITLLQQYISSPESFITRCEFVGGKFMYAVRVDTAGGFQLCPADACQIGDLFCPVGEEVEEKPKFQVIDDFQEDILVNYEQVLSANGVQVAGIEFIRDEDGVIYTYDINTNTNYNSDAEAAAGKSGMREVAKFLGSLLENVKNANAQVARTN